jgi:hypothetical protein
LAGLRGVFVARLRRGNFFVCTSGGFFWPPEPSRSVKWASTCPLLFEKFALRGESPGAPAPNPAGASPQTPLFTPAFFGSLLPCATLVSFYLVSLHACALTLMLRFMVLSTSLLSPSPSRFLMSPHPPHPLTALVTLTLGSDGRHRWGFEFQNGPHEPAAAAH